MMSRCASACVCAHEVVKALNAGRANHDKFKDSFNDFSLIRALTSTKGTPASWHSAVKLGQISVSIKRPMRGLKWAKNRLTTPIVSHGCQT